MQAVGILLRNQYEFVGDPYARHVFHFAIT